MNATEQWKRVRDLGRIWKCEEVEIELGADEVIDWLLEEPKRVGYALERLTNPDQKKDRPSAYAMRKLFESMDGLERDEFLRQIQGHVETQRITK